MTRNVWFLVICLLFTLVITQVSLRMRNIRPGKKISMWEHMLWEMAPEDEQTKEYYWQRFLTALVVLPVTVLVLYALTEWYGQIFSGTFIARRMG
jgi:hypothetical protein